MKALAQNTLIQNRYLIVQLIGKGGMGEVYLAVDQRLGSAVALKRTFFAGDEMLGNAFEREARILARMRHPVLPKVSDHFGEGEEQFLVMEHISGDDLSKRLEASQKPFPLSWVLFWADQLLDALSYLHSHEPPIIHRDIKPQNLKLTDENHIILLDFGLSKSSTGQTNITGTTSGGSSTGSVVGYTPHYAPMEQIRGIGTSPKSDLYSLAATLYQLMTNTVPADALSRADSLLNGMPDPIKAPSELNPEISYAVSDVLLKAMEVSQEKRYGTAREMQKELRKAFSKMQDAMSAQTVAFTLPQNQVPAIDAPAAVLEATAVMDPSAVHAISNPVIGGASLPAESRPFAQESASVDFDATIAMDPPVMDSMPTPQADVKTEVFLAGGNSNPFGSGVSDSPVSFDSKANSYSSPEPDDFTPPAPAMENFAPTQDYSNFSSQSSGNGPAPSDGYVPEATVPLIAFENGISNNEISGNEVYAQPNSYNTVLNREGPAYDPDGEYVQEKAPQAQVAAAIAPARAKSKSSSKVFALLGGLAALLILILAAAGGGYFVYQNYYAGSVVEPSPSPSPSEEPLPSPSPSAEDVFAVDGNSNTNTSPLGNTNVNSNTSDLTVEPTPVPRDEDPTTDSPDSRPNQQTPARNTSTPNRQQPAKNTNKATPKPKKGGDSTVILQ